jgi:LuxR family transcriptional regulator, maltose regulon positive regulatory protein
LFGEFLRAQFEKERPEQLDGLLHRIAAVYAEREEWVSAYAIYKHIGDPIATADLIEKAGTSLIRNTQSGLLAKWLDELPADVAEAQPSLLSHKGTVLLIQGQVEKSLEYLDRAEAAQRQNGDRWGLARTLDRRATAQRYRGNYEASIKDGGEALELSEGRTELRSVRAGAYRSMGVSLYYEGQLEKATEMLNQALVLFKELKEEQNVALVHMELGICRQYQGNTHEAVAHNEQALAYWQGVRNTPRQSFVLNNLGSLYHLAGNYTEAAKLFEQALILARSNNILRSEAYLLFNLGNLYSDLEAADSAKDAFQKTRDACQKLEDHFLLLNVDLAESTLARRDGKYPRANAYLRSAKERVEKSHSSFEESLLSLEAGNVALAENKLDTAVEKLQYAFGIFSDGGQKLEAASAALMLCKAYMLKEEEQNARRSIEQALNLVNDLESIQPLIVAGRVAKDTIRKYIDDFSIGSMAVKLLNRIENFERQIPGLRRKLRPHTSTVLLIPPKLSIYALGRAQVRLDGKPVTAPSWVNQKRARELFFFMVSHPNKGLSKEEIGLILWPDSSTELLRLQFRNTLYYIRYALGQDVIVSNDRRYLFNSDIDYSYDVQDFEHKVTQSEQAASPEQKITLLQEGLAIYQGEFFPEGDGDWVMTERQRLEEMREHNQLALAQLLLEQGEAKAALGYCQAILAENHCMESAHRLAMQAYAALGNRSGIKNQYEQCKQSLMDELSLDPSDETEKLYKLIS